MRADRDGAPHMGSTDIAAYVDGDLPAEQRHRMEAHLADCADCRDELVTVWRLATLEGAGAPRAGRASGWKRALGTAGAAAAAIVLVLVALPDPAEPPAAHRDTAAPTAPVAVAPQGQLSGGMPRFRWSGVAGADLYRVVLFDGDGNVIWEAETQDTTMLMPATVRLGAGQPHFWKVEARTDWDRWRSSGLVEFVVPATEGG